MREATVGLVKLSEEELSGHMRLLLTAEEVSKLLNVSLRTLWRLRSGGLMPAPIRIGGAVRWRGQEVIDWINSGCPTQSSHANGRRM